MRGSGLATDVTRKAAGVLVDAFEDYNASFADLTRRGQRRFEQGDRAGMRRDVIARYNLYDASADEAIARLESFLANRLFSRNVWRGIRADFGNVIAGRIDAELYKTFFNTITRRLFKTRGVDRDIEFFELDAGVSLPEADGKVLRHFEIGQDARPVLARLLDSHSFRLPWADVEGDASRLAERMKNEIRQQGMAVVERIEMIEAVFYREGRAYLVGRALAGEDAMPWIIALVSRDGSISVDAVLTRTVQVSILFGYTFSYFLADLPRVESAVAFLRQLLPGKPVDELYTVLGRAKQGKTERYRAFFGQLQRQPDERLVEAEGERGMVMLVFTLPSWPLVFKLIRDRFAPTKKFGRHRVIDRYRLVFRHDRVGRLLDVQEFKDLKFPAGRFDQSLLSELASQCRRAVVVDGGSVVIRHCYVERRVRPLDLFLAESDGHAAQAAVIDYGQALKDLARSNIFAGDLLPKNFGVTASGRVVFYDYDEIRLMSECRFRHLPDAGDDLLDMSDEPWFNIEGNDVFPEQFPRFMGLSRVHMAALAGTHGELFDPGWWQGIQARLAAGEAIDVPPYTAEARV